jgi:ABC-type multidrug transport system fused ATPase/permease subunit
MRLNSSSANSCSLARVVESISDEEEDEEDFDPETVSLQAARRRLTRLMSRSHAVVKNGPDGGLQRLTAKLLDSFLVVWRPYVVDKLDLVQLRLSELASFRQVALVATVIAAMLLLAGAGWQFWSRFVAARFSLRADNQ